MKQIVLYGGIAVIAYALWKKRQGATSTGTVGLTPPTEIAVSPATLVVPGATEQGCNTCDQVAGLGGDARITNEPQKDSPSAVSHSIMREDYDVIMPMFDRDLSI